MKKLYKTLSVLMATIVFVAMLCGISVNATETAIYKHFDVTDTNYTANTKLELNSIDDGLRQAINDVCQNYTGCQVTFLIKQTSFTDRFSEPKARLTANGFSFMSDTVTINGNYITFDFDKINTTHNKWGSISNLTFEATTDLTITDIYVYVPIQDKPKLNELSAGACAYETAIALQ